MAMADFLLFVATTAIAAVIARLYSGFSALQADADSFSSAASVGSRLFLLSDLLAAFVSPIMNNALLTVLFFKYHEQEGSIGELSAQVFRDRRGNSVHNIRMPENKKVPFAKYANDTHEDSDTVFVLQNSDTVM